MPSLAEIREEFASKQDHLGRLFAEAGPDLDLSRISSIDGDSEEKGAAIRTIQRELSDIGKKKDELESLEAIKIATERSVEAGRAVPQPMVFGGKAGGAPQSGHGQQNGSLRDILLQSKSYQNFRAGVSNTFQIDLPITDFKALITLTTVSPQNARRPDVVDLALEERTVSDLMMQGQVDRGVVEYYEETGFTNNATMTAEGSAKTESDMTFTLRSDTVRKVAHWLQATKESLDDVPFLETQMRGRLAFGVRRKEEQQVLSGDGTGQNILGLINRSGIQTQAVGGALTAMDAVYTAMQKVRGSGGLGFAEPTGLVMHPTNWTAIKLTKTADGIYLYGAPADEGVDRLWGLQVRQTTGITAGTAVLGAFRPYAEVLRREGVTVMLSTEHSTFMTDNKVLLIAESRLGLAVYRPSAFCTVTALP